ncbi:MAG TPA: hypothetical protein VFN35_34430 [Ktedonobacteraceae bacterium]|nr:hypothetical protein [Ktedonobacteraceae bacterium]
MSLTSFAQAIACSLLAGLTMNPLKPDLVSFGSGGYEQIFLYTV